MLAGVPVIASILLLFYSRSNSGKLLDLFSFLCFFPLLLWSVRAGLQPSPQLFDILGMLALSHVIHSRKPLTKKEIAIFLVFFTWANFGPSPIWGLVLIVCYGNASLHSGVFESGKKRARTAAESSNGNSHLLRWLFIASLGGMLTPRGILTWRDSLMLQSPRAFSDIQFFHQQGWQSAWIHDSWSTSEWSLLLLWCGWCGASLAFRRFADRREQARPSKFSAQRLRHVLILSVPLLAAVLAKNNIPLCGIWILIDIRYMLQSSTLQQNTQSPRFGVPRKAIASIVCLLVCASVLDAFGYGFESHRRLGFGISRELDLRLFDAQLVMASDEELIGWAPDGRSVGVVSWYDGKVRMADHPQRALLGNRLAAKTGFLRDILGAHRAQYRLDDGTWGGWVRQSDDWDVSMLIIPVEMQSVIRELSRTPWQQVDFDSPSVPFVTSTRPEFATDILEASQQQGFIEFGPWRPTRDIYAGMGWRYDIVELAGFGVNQRPAIYQSKIFRAINLPMASLRATLPVRMNNLKGPLKEEWLACQIDLAYQEWFSFGDASLFRRLVISKLTQNQFVLQKPWCKLESREIPGNSDEWDQSVQHYIEGDMLKALSGETASEQFSRAMLHLEIGDIQSALNDLDGVLKNQQNDSTFVAANYWKQQVEQFSSY